jgi:hypothetical protein
LVQSCYSGADNRWRFPFWHLASFTKALAYPQQDPRIIIERCFAVILRFPETSMTGSQSAAKAVRCVGHKKETCQATAKHLNL